MEPMDMDSQLCFQNFLKLYINLEKSVHAISFGQTKEFIKVFPLKTQLLSDGHM
jgi:hypothetical protein